MKKKKVVQWQKGGSIHKIGETRDVVQEPAGFRGVQILPGTVIVQ